MKRGALLLALLAWTGCAGPAGLLELADADTDEARRDAVRSAAEVLANPREAPGMRVAAALSLGRLRRSEADAVAALERGLAPRSPHEVRAASAWALGELRSEASLPPVLGGLRSRPGSALGRQLLQAVAKHHALLAARPDLVVEVVSAMTHFSGNLVDGTVPPAYDLIGARTRTLEVDVEVIEKAIEAHRARPTAQTAAALYAAAFEILTRLDVLRAELAAAGASTRAQESLRAATAAARSSDSETARLVTWFLGQLADEPFFATPASEAMGELRREALPAGDRLVAAWALARAQLHALEARRALASELLVTETDAEVLRALGASTGGSAEDILQRVLGIEVESR